MWRITYSTEIFLKNKEKLCWRHLLRTISSVSLPPMWPVEDWISQEWTLLFSLLLLRKLIVISIVREGQEELVKLGTVLPWSPSGR